MTGRYTPPYPHAFRQDVIDAYHQRPSYKKISKQYGISDSTVKRWVFNQSGRPRVMLKDKKSIIKHYLKYKKYALTARRANISESLLREWVRNYYDVKYMSDAEKRAYLERMLEDGAPLKLIRLHSKLSPKETLEIYHRYYQK